MFSGLQTASSTFFLVLFTNSITYLFDIFLQNDKDDEDTISMTSVSVINAHIICLLTNYYFNSWIRKLKYGSLRQLSVTIKHWQKWLRKILDLQSLR